MSKLLKRAMMTLVCTTVILSMVGCGAKTAPTSADVKAEATEDVEAKVTDDEETEDLEQDNDNSETEEKDATEDADDTQENDEDETEEKEEAESDKEEEIALIDKTQGLTEKFGSVQMNSRVQIEASSEKSIKKQFAGTWDTLVAIDSETDEEVELTDLFGSSVRSYGSSLTLNSDGTFLDAIQPVTSSEQSVTGTYTIVEDQDDPGDYWIDLSYDDGTDTYLYAIQVEEGQYLVASLDYLPYYVYLLKED